MLKVTDELQFGVPECLYDADKVFNIDFSEFDLKDKKQEKKALAKVETTIRRFVAREKRTKGFIWSRPTIDFEAGTATLAHSRVADISTQAFFDAGTVYGFTSAVESAWDSGKNWYDCH